VAGSPINLGLIGAGPWGKIYIKTIAGLEGVQLAHLASGNSDSKSLVDSDCKISTDWRELIADKIISGVIIATPPQHHAEIACAALDAGKAVLVEKPMTLDVNEADEIRECAIANNGLVLVEHTHLFRPAYREIKDRIATSGPARGVWSSVGDHGPYRRHTPVLWDWGSHEVALALGVLERTPVSVAARVLERREVEGGIGENHHLRLTFSESAVADITFGNLTDRHRRFAVFFDDTVLAYDDAVPGQLMEYPAQLDVAEPKGEGRAIPISNEMPVTVAVREFANAISNGDTSTASLDQGVEVTRILAQCQERMG
jgi:predicted dehydrogenase